MPGLIGFTGNQRSEQSKLLIENMAASLDSQGGLTRELHSDEGFGLGRVSQAVMNPGQQPFWSQNRALGVVVEGEIYDIDPVSPALRRAKDEMGDSHGLERLLLSLHQQGALSELRLVDGSFAAAIWDKTERTLTLVNDRMGLQPLYYAQVADGTVFASGVRALLADTRVRRDIDAVAMADFLTHDHVLGQRTLLRAVSLLPQASILTCRGDKAELEVYWAPRPQAQHLPFSEDAYFDGLVPILRRAVGRRLQDGDETGLLLSGGLDSRALLATMAENTVNGDLSTFTWGIPKCDDARYAEESAREVGTRHRFYELKPDWLLDQAERGVRITDGMSNVVNLHALATLDQTVEHSTILFKGFLGDAMFGFGLRPRYWACYTPQDAYAVHMQAYRDYDVLTFDLPEHELLFTPAFREVVGNGVSEDYRSVIRSSQMDELALQRIYIDFTQRVPRMTLNGVLVLRDRAVIRLPFADNELVDFSLSVPPGLALGREVMVEAFRRSYPDLAQVPTTTTGRPIVACFRDVLIQTWSLAQWHLRKRGLGRLAGPRTKPYKDYDQWFRHELRSWIMDLLLSRSALERGYFTPAYVQGLVKSHMGGENHAVRLGALASLELWHRMYIDA